MNKTTKPHFCTDYVPDIQAMGDCRNCGHVYETHYPLIGDVEKCQGFEIEPGVFSGCDQSAGDCPVCGE